MEKSPGTNPDHLDRLREKLLTIKLIRKIEAKEKPTLRWWQTEWFFRLLVLVLALLIGIIDIRSTVAGWIK
ncbi:hypothetical protein DNA98_05525 [Meiothermus sp. Pnk-1]|nr:hypothetical protein DNA98_05525 [Meiothermus sp. Pnk-1]